MNLYEFVLSVVRSVVSQSYPKIGEEMFEWDTSILKEIFDDVEGGVYIGWSWLAGIQDVADDLVGSYQKWGKEGMFQ